MRALILTIVLLSTCFVCFGQADMTSWIKESSSNAITLSDETNFSIYGVEKLTLERTYEVVIKNRYAEELKSIEVYYDKYQQVDKVEAFIYDLTGQEVERYKSKDFGDIAIGLSSTASDGRMKYLEINRSQYPYIIKVKYSITKSGSLHYPIWKPQSSEKQRMVSAKLNVFDYTGNSFRYYGFNTSSPQIKNMEKGVHYSWYVENKEPFEFEYLNNNIEYYAPVVYTAPNFFEMDNYKGDMSSWESFGQWINQLNNGKDDLNTEDLKDLDQLIKEAESEQEKVAVIYKYLQQNTRYVSIQLGIGGWQPFKASEVHEKKYGDCKALSFYTKSLLENYGIDSYYTLINAGAEAPLLKYEFPNAHFNHAIITVPMESDTLFLECTSQTNPVGYLGTFTSDRGALMITEKGGVVVKTKKYSEVDNIQSTKVGINLNEQGDGEMSLIRTYSGIEIDNQGFASLYHRPISESNQWLLENHNWGNLHIDSFYLRPIFDGPVPSGGFGVLFSHKKEAVLTGNRLFFKPGKYSNSYMKKLPSGKRRTPIEIRYGYTQIDSVIINPPPSFIFEKLLTTKEINTKFGSYQRKLVNNQGQLLYIRKFVIKADLYPQSEYEEFREFINSVNRFDQEQVVLIDKT